MKSVYLSPDLLRKINFTKTFAAKVLGACCLLSDEYRFFAYRYTRLHSMWGKKAYCHLTGRSRGYLSSYAVSRLCFKAYAMSGEYSGIKKFVW